MVSGFTFNDLTIQRQDTRHLGFILNLGQKALSGTNLYGTHWVAAYYNLDTNKGDYFDPLGQLVPNSAKLTIQSIIDALSTRIPENEIQFTMNTLQLQTGGTECGVWCVLFLVLRISGYTLKQLKDLNLSDDLCKNLRNFFWNRTLATDVTLMESPIQPCINC